MGGRRLVRVRLAILLSCLGLIALVGATYREAPKNDFHFDDIRNIRDNAAVRIDHLSWHGLRRAATDAPLKRRKLAYVSFALDWWRGGGAPTSFLVTNVALHAANSLLVLALLLTVLVTDQRPADLRVVLAALGGASTWAVHPIQVQAVTYIVQRMAEMAAFFTLLAVLFYVRGRREELRSHVVWWMALCGLALVAGGLSKENALIAPLLLVLVELGVVRANRALFRTRAEGAMLVTLAAAGSVVFLITLAGLGPIADRLESSYAAFRDFTMQQRALTQPRVVLFHISQILWPLPQRFSLEHDFAVSQSLIAPLSTLAAGLAALCWSGGGVWLLTRRDWRPLGFLALWFPATLAIESSIVPLEMVFEHRMYLPSIALFGIAAWAVHRAALKSRRPCVTIALPFTVVTLLLSWSTMIRVPMWRSALSLAQNTVRVAPHSARAWAGLGLARLRESDVDSARAALERSLSLDPNDRVALEYMGVILMDEGQPTAARQHLSRALAIDPKSTSLANHLGEMLLRSGEYEKAYELFRAAIDRRPWVPAYHWNSALALERLDRCDEALAAWQAYLETEPDEAERTAVLRHLQERFDPAGAACRSREEP